MKKLLAIFLLLTVSIFGISSCSSKNESVVETVEDSIYSDGRYTVVPSSSETENTEIPESMLPNVMRIRNICQLATCRVYFHNVARNTADKDSGISGWFSEERTFWIPYNGFVEVGIDMTRVEMTITDTEIIVALPDAEILSGVNVIEQGETLRSEQHWYNVNLNEITPERETAAMSEANTQIASDIAGNAAIMMTARERAEDLIRNYIEALSEYSNVEYRVSFVDVSEA